MVKLTFRKVTVRYKVLDPIKVRLKYFKGFTIKTEYATLGPGGLLYVKPGCRWDGATCAVDTDSIMLASLVHDILYRWLREGRLPQEMRKAADQELRRLCRMGGMAWFRSWYVYRAVRRAAAGAAAVDENGKNVTIEYEGEYNE